MAFLLKEEETCATSQENLSLAGQRKLSFNKLCCLTNLIIFEMTNLNLISTRTVHSIISTFQFLMKIACIKVNFSSARINNNLLFG